MGRFLAILVTAAILGACTTSRPAGQAILGPSPALGGGYFTSGGGITVAAEVRNMDGKTGVCGAWSQSERQSVLSWNRARDMLRPAAVILGREALVTGLQFMRETPPRRDYAGVESNCVVLDRPWRAADAARQPRILIPLQVVYEDVDITGGIRVLFRPSGPSAHPDDPKPWDR